MEYPDYKRSCRECVLLAEECTECDSSAEAATQRLNEKQAMMERAAKPMQTHSFDGGEP